MSYFPIVISAPPQAGEYEVECVTAATTDHADPRWLYFCLPMIAAGVRTRAPDIALANDVITDVWQDSDGQLYAMCEVPGTHWLPLRRICFVGHPQVCVMNDMSITALTMDAMRYVAPGTVMYSRRTRMLWVRRVGMLDATGVNVYVLPVSLRLETEDVFIPSVLSRAEVDRSDIHIVCDATDEYCLK